jgi:heptosyltransferase-1
MPRILLVKTSSMGDIVHCLPVASDIRVHVAGAEIHWLAEEAFAEIPRLHPGIASVIPIAWRRWRRSLFSGATRIELRALRDTLASFRFDSVLDLQGLMKSALFGLLAGGTRMGLDWRSAWEPLATLSYHRHFSVPPAWHAVDRYRHLAAQAVGYTLAKPLEYGIDAPRTALDWLPAAPFALLLSATSREEKLWPEERWIAVGNALANHGLIPVLLWGSAAEEARARRIGEGIAQAVIAPRLSLLQAAATLGRARVVIGVDTGLLHLASALAVPTIGIYCGSRPEENGVRADTPHANLGGPRRAPAVAEVLDTARAIARP